MSIPRTVYHSRRNRYTPSNPSAPIISSLVSMDKQKQKLSSSPLVDTSFSTPSCNTISDTLTSINQKLMGVMNTLSSELTIFENYQEILDLYCSKHSQIHRNAQFLLAIWGYELDLVDANIPEMLPIVNNMITKKHYPPTKQHNDYVEFMVQMNKCDFRNTITMCHPHAYIKEQIRQGCDVSQVELYFQLEEVTLKYLFNAACLNKAPWAVDAYPMANKIEKLYKPLRKTHVVYLEKLKLSKMDNTSTHNITSLVRYVTRNSYAIHFSKIFRQTVIICPAHTRMNVMKPEIDPIGFTQVFTALCNFGINVDFDPYCHGSWANAVSEGTDTPIRYRNKIHGPYKQSLWNQYVQMETIRRKQSNGTIHPTFNIDYIKSNKSIKSTEPKKSKKGTNHS